MSKQILLLLLVSILISAHIFGGNIEQSEIIAWAKSIQSNPLKLPIYVLFSVIMCFATLPLGAITKVISGWLFGFEFGFTVSYFSILLGSWLAFLLARYLGYEIVNRKWEKQSRKVNLFLKDGGLVPLIQLRLFPFLPLPVSNYILGVTKTTSAQFLTSSAIGMLPATLFYSYVGSLLNGLTEESLNFKYFTPFYIYIFLALLMTLCLQLLRKNKKF